MMAKR